MLSNAGLHRSVIHYCSNGCLGCTQACIIYTIEHAALYAPPLDGPVRIKQHSSKNDASQTDSLGQLQEGELRLCCELNVVAFFMPVRIEELSRRYIPLCC